MSVNRECVERKASLKWSGGTVLLRGPCVIGRRSDNDLPINNVQVSRRHALVMNLNDDWWVNDLGSRNGVMINGIRLNNARKLRDGDEIRIANQRILFRNTDQSLPHQSTLVGKTTQVAAEVYDASSPVSHELIIATTKGAILEGDKAAHWFFGKALERAPGGEHYILPLVVRQWLERVSNADEPGLAPLELEENQRRVIISIARCTEGRCFLLLREESSIFAIKRLQSLDLTPREAEVMYWICEGKLNSEIVHILHVTVHTVNRHVEHIFRKLGVDNRQKAVLVVKERLGIT